MKDNRMRQTRNKWNNRGPRQVKLSTLPFTWIYAHFYKTMYFRVRFKLKIVNHLLLFSLHGKSLKKWISLGSINYLYVLARKLLICNQNMLELFLHE
jgi:hypothetical protein